MNQVLQILVLFQVKNEARNQRDTTEEPAVMVLSGKLYRDFAFHL
jgi:hypothetical protein